MNRLKEVYRNDLPGRFNEMEMLDSHFSRILNVFNGNILPPYEILIHTSSICNLNCKWCIGGYVSSKANKDALLDNNLFKKENMVKIVNSIINYRKIGYDYKNNCNKEYKVENVTFSGITGEPLIAKDSILYAIDELSKHNIRVGMFTNGVLINKEIHKTLLKLGYILISIDAGNAETYNKLKCNGNDTNNFDIILKNIEELNESKKKYDSNIDINVGYVINQHNYNQIYELAAKLKKIGVHYLRFKTDIASLLVMNDEQKNSASEQIKRVRKELCDDYFSVVEIHDVMSDKEKIRKFSKCFVHYLIGNISADGRVYLCNYHPKKNGYNYGSAIEQDFSEIWEGILESDVDDKIPKICPSVCDPFKNRANRLLEIAYEIYKEDGLESLIKNIEEIKESK